MLDIRRMKGVWAPFVEDLFKGLKVEQTFFWGGSESGFSGKMTSLVKDGVSVT